MCWWLAALLLINFDGSVRAIAAMQLVCWLGENFLKSRPYEFDIVVAVLETNTSKLNTKISLLSLIWIFFNDLAWEENACHLETTTTSLPCVLCWCSSRANGIGHKPQCRNQKLTKHQSLCAHTHTNTNSEHQKQPVIVVNIFFC